MVIDCRSFSLVFSGVFSAVEFTWRVTRFCQRSPSDCPESATRLQEERTKFDAALQDVI